MRRSPRGVTATQGDGITRPGYTKLEHLKDPRGQEALDGLGHGDGPPPPRTREAQQLTTPLDCRVSVEGGYRSDEPDDTIPEPSALLQGLVPVAA